MTGPGAPQNRTTAALCSLWPATGRTLHWRHLGFSAGAMSGAGSSPKSDHRRAVQPLAHDRQDPALAAFRFQCRRCVGRRVLPRIGPPPRCAASGPRQAGPCTGGISASMPALCRAPGAPPDRTTAALCSLCPTTGGTLHWRHFAFSAGAVSGAGNFPGSDHRRAVQHLAHDRLDSALATFRRRPCVW